MGQEDELQSAVRNAMAGASLVLLGTAIAKGGGMIAEILVIRTFTQSEYGLLKLAIITTTVAGSIATLGFTTGLPRQLGVEIGRENDRRVRETVWSGLFVSAGLAVVVAVGLFVGAPLLGMVFDAPRFVQLMRVFAVAAPAVILIDVLVAAARGLGDSKPKVYFKQLLPKLFFLGGIGIIVAAELPFIAVAFVWVGGYLLTALAFLPYGRKMEQFKPVLPSRKVVKTLIAFSLPLLAVFIINRIHTWVDTFLVGLYLKPNAVGLYGATVLLTRTIPMVLGSVSFMYIPLASRLQGAGDMDQMQQFYRIMTKWIIGATLPIFLTLFLYPETILINLFGIDYGPGATVMRLLAVGFFSHTLLGTNGQSLVVIGRRNFLALALAIAVVVNTGVSVALIPRFGIEGAALGSVAAYVTSNFFISAYLYRTAKLHPFSWSYALPLLATMVTTGWIWVFFGEFFHISIYRVLLFAVLISIVHTVTYLATRSMDPSEVTLIEAILGTVGVPKRRVMTVIRWAGNVEK